MLPLAQRKRSGRRRNRRSLKLGLLLLVLAGGAQADIVWHWQDSFNGEEKATLRDWVTRTVSAVEDLVAPYPFDVHIYFYQMPGRGEPVPWAQTRRGRLQGVDFHVDPAYPLASFLADWTAPHELSHLLIPYLGERYSWFAEGFASFMQYQVMQEMEVITAAEVAEQYRSHIALARARYTLDHAPFHQAARELRRRREYPTLYWGGAVYFLGVDQRLSRHGFSLVTLLSEYLSCCRGSTSDLDELVRQLDKLSGSELFREAMWTMQHRPGFPVAGELVSRRDDYESRVSDGR